MRYALAPMKIKFDINLKNIIMPYSMIKINAKRPPPYSMLNPDTISDSPSAKSNGVRFDSAIHIITQVKNNGNDRYINHKFSCIIFIFHIE